MNSQALILAFSYATNASYFASYFSFDVAWRQHTYSGIKSPAAAINSTPYESLYRFAYSSGRKPTSNVPLPTCWATVCASAKFVIFKFAFLSDTYVGSFSVKYWFVTTQAASPTANVNFALSISLKLIFVDESLYLSALPFLAINAPPSTAVPPINLILSYPLEMACTSGTNPNVNKSKSAELLFNAVNALVPWILTPVTFTPSSLKNPFSNATISPDVLITPVGIEIFNSPYLYSPFELFEQDATPITPKPNNAPKPKTFTNFFFFFLSFNFLFFSF